MSNIQKSITGETNARPKQGSARFHAPYCKSPAIGCRLSSERERVETDRWDTACRRSFQTAFERRCLKTVVVSVKGKDAASSTNREDEHR